MGYVQESQPTRHGPRMGYDVLFMGLAFLMAPMGALLHVKPWQPHEFLWAAVGDPWAAKVAHWPKVL